MLGEFKIFLNAWRELPKPFYFKPWRRVQRTRQQGMFQCEDQKFQIFRWNRHFVGDYRRTKSMILLVYVIAKKCRKIFRSSQMVKFEGCRVY